MMWGAVSSQQAPFVASLALGRRYIMLGEFVVAVIEIMGSFRRCKSGLQLDRGMLLQCEHCFDSSQFWLKELAHKSALA